MVEMGRQPRRKDEKDMKPKTIRVGMLDASTVTQVGYREIVIDLAELRRNLAEIRRDANVPLGTDLHLRVEHNGCSDSACHECGGGALDVMVEYDRAPTAEEVSSEAEHQTKLEARRRRDYERLKKRYEG